MVLSLPIDSWLLLFVAVGLGLAMEVAFYRAQRARGRAAAGDDVTPDVAPEDGSDA